MRDGYRLNLVLERSDILCVGGHAGTAMSRLNNVGRDRTRHRTTPDTDCDDELFR
jgi:hypothetical protein